MNKRLKLIKGNIEGFGILKTIIIISFYAFIYLMALINHKKLSLESLLGLGLYLLGPFLLFILYLLFLKNKNLKEQNTYLIILIMVLTIILSKLFMVFSPYIIPQATGGILLALLLGPQLALVSNIYLIWTIGIIFDLDLALIFIGIIANSFGILLIYKEKQRSKILLDGIFIGLIGSILYISIHFLETRDNQYLLINIIYIISGGFLSGIISIGTIPLWEAVFKVLTPFKLLELINPDNKLLKDLSLQARGTYHHSLLVGNLCEAAAENIGANKLLAKAGAYYHDIGKLKRPLYFKENQFGIENPHDHLEPIQSLEIILAHRTDGLKMGKDYKLPKEIIDIIDQHHGKTLMAYFYHKAKESNEMVPMDKFRYSGSKPQTKEAALVMLADSVEAAVRSLREFNDENIQEMVSKVIKSKLEDEQLDEAPISSQDLRIIKEVFVKEIRGIYHNRIRYPQ